MKEPHTHAQLPTWLLRELDEDGALHLCVMVLEGLLGLVLELGDLCSDHGADVLGLVVVAGGSICLVRK
jgi:hypothetical protein